MASPLLQAPPWIVNLTGTLPHGCSPLINCLLCLSLLVKTNVALIQENLQSRTNGSLAQGELECIRLTMQSYNNTQADYIRNLSLIDSVLGKTMR